MMEAFPPDMTKAPNVSGPRVRILMLLTWYTPHLSGLTVVAQRIATGLRALGHEVTVLTSQHRHDLPAEETIDGVRVIRSPVAARISKGVLMPLYIRQARRLALTHDVLLMFLPAGPDACVAGALAGRNQPLLVEYICDIRLPGGWLSRVIERTCGAFFHYVARAAGAITVHSGDYANTSPFLAKYKDKVHIARLPIRMSEPRAAEIAEFRAKAGGARPVIGIAARLAADKGFELLLDALPLIRRRFPDVHVLYAGNYANVVGEEAYRAAILPRIAQLGDRWCTLGVVQPDLASFFAACDVLVLPSVNRTESFGMVQVEAMLCGTPVVASDFPGIRVAIETTGMGKLFPSGDLEAFAEAVIWVLENRDSLVKPRAEIERFFSDELAVQERLRIIRDLLAERA
jgi:glycosyltransferase involved in cell wall biosynthesis